MTPCHLSDFVEFANRTSKTKHDVKEHITSAVKSFIDKYSGVFRFGHIHQAQYTGLIPFRVHIGKHERACICNNFQNLHSFTSPRVKSKVVCR